jgi:hypothetical protein
MDSTCCTVLSERTYVSHPSWFTSATHCAHSELCTPIPCPRKIWSQRSSQSGACMHAYRNCRFVGTYACTMPPRSLTRLQYVRRNAWTLLNGLYYAPNVTSSVECPILQVLRGKRYGRSVMPCHVSAAEARAPWRQSNLNLNDMDTYVQYRDSLIADIKTPTNIATQRSAPCSSRLSLLPASITTVQSLSETRLLAR